MLLTRNALRVAQMSGYTIAWLTCGGAAAIIETLALIRGARDDTLSENTRRLFRTRGSKVGRVVFAAGWLVFAGWFVVHILWPN